MNRVKRWVSNDGRAGYNFHCPGCNEAHTVRTEPDGWGFNDDLERPTFSPSILLRSGHFSTRFQPGDECWCTWEKEDGSKSGFECAICHSFVIDGKIQFLGDCTHAMAGQTVDLPVWRSEAG